ncbi:MAG: ECF transporter S component [Clostridiales bacterium]|jgi:hypothetical protein|nr:ECF transporter S component [Clostridiales bacterium]
MDNVRFMTRTALLLAVTVACQMLRPLITLPGLGSTLIIGSLVNASLAVSSVVVGIWGGIIISVAAPIIAFMQQHIAFIWLIPIVATGNLVLVILYGLWYRKNKWIAIGLSSVLKTLVLYLLVKAAIGMAAVPAPAAAVMSMTFSWPQLVTAAIGGFLASLVLKVLADTGKVSG